MPQYAGFGKDWRPDSGNQWIVWTRRPWMWLIDLGYMQAQKTGKAARPRNRCAFAVVCLP